MENSFGNIIYKYYCKECSKFFKMSIDFDERLKDWGCPKCLKKLKFVGGTDARVAGNGCGYVSYEKQSEINWKNLSQDQKEKALNDSFTVQRDKRDVEANKGRWWRDFCPDPDKPLDLSRIKDTEKFIMTGEVE